MRERARKSLRIATIIPTLITFPRTSAARHVRLHPVKFTDDIQVEFFIALQTTAVKKGKYLSHFQSFFNGKSAILVGCGYKDELKYR